MVFIAAGVQQGWLLFFFLRLKLRSCLQNSISIQGKSNLEEMAGFQPELR